jgi:hypothetical protein
MLEQELDGVQHHVLVLLRRPLSRPVTIRIRRSVLWQSSDSISVTIFEVE